MMTPHVLNDLLAQMPSLTNLFRLFQSGHHLNRLSQPALWSDLEKNQDNYTSLFEALGFELKIDVRGFAWFHHRDTSSHINKTSRQLALLFMLIFDEKATVGKELQRFTDWLIDKDYVNELYKQQQDLLDAEGLAPDEIVDLLNRASHLGFTSAEAGGWRLLPAVCRYLDHFEGLAQALQSKEEEDAMADDEGKLNNEEVS